MRPWLGEEEADGRGRGRRAPAGSRRDRGWPSSSRLSPTRIGVPHAVAVSSLHHGPAPGAPGLPASGPGDEVVVPSLSFIATANAVRYVGRAAGFADVDAATRNLTAETVEPCLTDRTRAVIVVDQAGVPADLDAIRALCDPRGHHRDRGRRLRGRLDRTGAGPVGAGADLAALSFHPRKLLTTGEGGMLVTPDAEVAARLRRLREHGMNVSAADRHASSQPVLERYLEVGFNYRMTDIQAAVGLVQLGKLRSARAPAPGAGRSATTSCWPTCPVCVTAADPAYGQTNYPVVLGAAAGRLPGRPRRTAALAGGRGHLRPARHHGRPSRAGLRGVPGPAAAGHRAAQPELG